MLRVVRNLASSCGVAAAMRGITVKQFGGPEVLQYVTDLPAPGKATGKQLVVSVKSVGINPIDTYIRGGGHNIRPTLPYTPGSDGAGIVEQVGEQVTKFKVGDRVYWCQSGSGSYAEKVITEESSTYPLHKSLSFQQGSSLGVPYFSAYRALMTKAALRPGETVLIHGASGAVGTACCQIARALGAKVLGTAGTADGLQLVLDNGAHKAFNHREPGYLDKIKADGRIDVIIEMLANVNLEKDFDLAGHGSRIVVVGSRGRIEIAPRAIMMHECLLTGIMLFHSTPSEWAEMGAYMTGGQEAGIIRPVVGQEFPLERASDAHKEVIEHSAGSKGKIVLTV